MNYRADIDGLRAVAVIAVILFHFGIGNLTGGFIGVDVFFVLSGYLIGALTFGQLANQRFSFSHFYYRRIRRLMPVYVVVIVATSVVAYALMLPKDFRDYGQSIFASTVYVSNILFYIEAGYFDAGSHVKPLLHTWSLSVEEQFYLVFPLVAWLTYRLARHWVVLLFIVLTVLSFLAAVLYIDQDQSAVFFLYPFRAWEMFIGTLLALGVIPPIRDARWSSVAAVTGIVLIVVPCFVYDSTTLFPGYTALAPCLGTALLVHSGAHTPVWLHRLLASQVPVFIGKISYSLYLWHWPIYVLYFYSSPYSSHSVLDSLIMLLLTFVLSVLSWKFVEKPFREGRIQFVSSHRALFGSTAVVSSLLLAVGFYIYISDGAPSRLTEDESRFASVSMIGELPECVGIDNTIFPGLKHCVLQGKPLQADNYTLVWADSHGAAFASGVSEALKGLDNNTLLAWLGGCPPVFDVERDELIASTAEDNKCPALSAAVRQLVARDREKINAIIIIGRWSYYINGEGFGIDSHNTISLWPEGKEKGSVADQGEFFLAQFESTMRELNDYGIKPFVVEQPPEFSQFHSRNLAMSLINGRASIEEVTSQYATVDYLNVLARQGLMQSLLQRIEAEGLITVLHTHPYFCTEQSCSAMLEGRPVFYDNNHVSLDGARQISSMFAPAVEAVVKFRKD